MDWDRTPPQVPILGSNEINKSPYTVPPDDTSLYEEYMTKQKDGPNNFISNLWRLFSPNLAGQNQDMSDNTIVKMVLKDYPRRGDILVDVMDFSPARSQRSQHKLENISEWIEKPSWAVVRWIHAPLGPTWLSCFLEDEVLTCGPRGFPFSHAGRPEFPYFAAEAMSFYSHSQFSRLRNIFARFSLTDSPVARRVGANLLRALWQGELIPAIHEYKGQRGRRPKSFWELAAGELPRGLDEETEHARLSDPFFGAEARRDRLDRQILSQHPYFHDAQTVRSRLRFYHRSDGFILSMAPPMGIQYLHRDWYAPSIAATYIEYANTTWGSLIPQVFHQLSKGVDKWYRMDENWLMIYIATEMCSLPSGRLGGQGLLPEEAYFVILQDLKRRRRSQWNDKSAVTLVRDLVDFNDEVHLWLKSLERQLTFLGRLDKDRELLEQYWRQSPAPHHLQGSGSDASTLIEKASTSVQLRKFHLEQTFTESNRVLEALFRLRTIQQNELANSADRLNKAIVAFTVTTIIFLPLNFFTSYFTMLPVLYRGPGSLYTVSLKEFWVFAVSIGTVVLVSSMLFAFRYHVIQAIRMAISPKAKRYGNFKQDLRNLA